MVVELEPVARFRNPGECFADGKPKPVIDLVLPQSTLNETILTEYVTMDEHTQHFIPTVEAALASKYAAMGSRLRDREKQKYDTGYFRRVARAKFDRIRRKIWYLL